MTNSPKLQAGIELKRLITILCETNEIAFTSALEVWYATWSSFLKERTTDPVTGRWHHTHKRLRSAYRSLKIKPPLPVHLPEVSRTEHPEYHKLT